MAQTKVNSGGIATDAVESTAIKDLNVTAAKLSNTLDLSSKTVTLPTTAISYPTFTSITPSTTTNESTSFVIVGTNFGATGIPAVEFQNATGGITAATSIVRDSATQLTVVATLAVDGTYYIRIELNTGLAVRSSTAALTISDAPVWTTGSGTLGTIVGDFSGTVATVAATGDTVTYSEVSGTGLTGAGNANCALNSSTGVITTTDFGGSSTEGTTYNFTIRATDAQAQTSDRAFSLTSSFTYPSNFLVIAGGGGGGGVQSIYGGAGGGAGGYRTSIGTSGGGASAEPATAFEYDAVYTITVGTGGAGGGTNANGVVGVDSSIIGTGVSITSLGGGFGGSTAASGDGGDGGSGGGAGLNQAIGDGTAGQGYGGGLSVGSPYDGKGGGGGASAAGQTASGPITSGHGGNGGAGLSSSITGSSVARGGGGGGGSGSGQGSGGTGGGGAASVAGTANTGGGGGGGTTSSDNAAAGGSGVVILSMLTSDYSGTTSGSPTVSTDGSNTILVYNASGSYTG